MAGSHSTHRAVDSDWSLRHPSAQDYFVCPGGALRSSRSARGQDWPEVALRPTALLRGRQEFPESERVGSILRKSLSLLPGAVLFPVFNKLPLQRAAAAAGRERPGIELRPSWGVFPFARMWTQSSRRQGCAGLRGSDAFVVSRCGLRPNDRTGLQGLSSSSSNNGSSDHP